MPRISTKWVVWCYIIIDLLVVQQLACNFPKEVPQHAVIHYIKCILAIHHSYWLNCHKMNDNLQGNIKDQKKAV